VSLLHCTVKLSVVCAAKQLQHESPNVRTITEMELISNG
jgi:hypothetical protein